MDRLAGGAALPEGFSLRMLGPQDAQAVIGLEVQIDEFADSFRGVDREEKVEECRENLTRGGHAFGVYDLSLIHIFSPVMTTSIPLQMLRCK